MSKSSPAACPRPHGLSPRSRSCAGPPQRRTSTLPCSSAPTGTLSCGRLGTASSRLQLGLDLVQAGGGLLQLDLGGGHLGLGGLGAVLVALGMSMPICLESWRLAGPAAPSVRVCGRVLRSVSRARKASTFEGLGILRALQALDGDLPAGGRRAQKKNVRPAWCDLHFRWPHWAGTGCAALPITWAGLFHPAMGLAGRPAVALFVLGRPVSGPRRDVPGLAPGEPAAHHIGAAGHGNTCVAALITPLRTRGTDEAPPCSARARPCCPGGKPAAARLGAGRRQRRWQRVDHALLQTAPPGAIHRTHGQ